MKWFVFIWMINGQGVIVEPGGMLGMAETEKLCQDAATVLSARLEKVSSGKLHVVTKCLELPEAAKAQIQ